MESCYHGLAFLAQINLGPMTFLGLVAIVVLVLGLIVLGMVAIYGKLWLQAYMSGADVSFASLIGMGFRQVNPRVIVNAKEANDESAAKICRDIAQAFEQRLTYPGEIKVTVLRETRIVELAR